MKRILTHLFLLVATATSVFAASPKVQIVHNAADPQTDSINLYLIDTVTHSVIDSAINLRFRTATPIWTLVSGTNVRVAIAPPQTGGGNSASAFKTFDLGVVPDSNFIYFLNGVPNPVNFAVNPDGKSIALNLYTKHNARFQAIDPTKAELAYFHGVTDGPTIDVTITVPAVATLVNDLSYGSYQDYSAVAPTTYIVKVTNAAGTTVLKSYLAPLATAQGAAAVVFASGFLNPAANNNGAAFAIYAVTNTPGGPLVFPLREITTANVQIIHNAADTSLSTVDVYVTDSAFSPIMKFDNVDFRTGTAYGDLPANKTLKVIFAGKNSTGIIDSLKTFNVGPFTTDSFYVAIAAGVANVANYAANPDGNSTALDLYVHSGKVSAPAHKAALILFHGCTDAPTIDVKSLLPAVSTIVDDISYGEYNTTGYLTLDSGNYVIQITNADQTTVVKAYSAPLSLTVGRAAVVYASGFLNPTANSNGPSFTVQVTLPNAITLSLPEYVGINETKVLNGVKMFPNPANAVTRINFNLEQSANVKFQLTTMAGETIQSANLGNLAAGSNNVDINVSDLSNGVYMMSLIVDGGASFTRPVIVNK